MPFKVLFGNGYKAAEDLGAYIILCILKGSKLNCCEIADVCACTIIMLLIYFCYLSVDVVFFLCFAVSSSGKRRSDEGIQI